MIDQNEYLEKVEYANQLAKAYYVEAESLVEDYVYDDILQTIKLYERLHPEAISSNSPTQHVGGISQSSFAKVIHAVPMLSLDDYFNKEDVEEWVNKFPQERFCVEEKIDGLSMSVTYNKGRIVQAETRGDGFIGEDITENAKYVAGIPSSIEYSGLLEVRCEVYLPEAEFIRLNEKAELEGRKCFANPRNAAAGLLRTHDIEVVKNANLHAFAFNVQRTDHEGIANHHQSLVWLTSLGFDSVMSYSVPANLVTGILDTIQERRASLPYWIDGAVIKLDNLSVREKLGAGTKNPNWAIAYKYPAEEKQTVIREIILQTGRTGRVSPVAVFDPIQLAGTTVTRATLHNNEIIHQLDLNVGDTILVKKSGDIIPCVLSVTKRVTPHVCYELSNQCCPSCGKPLSLSESGKEVYCTNPDCIAQLSRRIIQWCSRACMNIEGMGPQIIQDFIDMGWIRNIPDIYHLEEHKDKMLQMDRYGEAKVQKLISSINKSKTNSLDRVISGFGINGIGASLAKKLTEKYSSLTAISNASLVELQALLGPVAGKTIHEWFSNTYHIAQISELNAVGVNTLSNISNNVPSSNVFSGKSFVITGTFENYKRKELEDMVIDRSGKVQSGVNKTTDYLLCGSAAGSKLQKAKELGTTIIYEDNLEKFLSIS